jgi:hypothetical protein
MLVDPAIAVLVFVTIPVFNWIAAEGLTFGRPGRTSGHG